MSSASFKPDLASSPDSLAIPWNPWWALIFAVCIYYISQIISGFVVSVYGLFTGLSETGLVVWLENTTGAQFAYMLIAETLTIGAVYLFLRYYRRGFASIGLRRPKWSDLGYGFAALPLYFLVYVLTVILVSSIAPGLDVDQKQEIGFENVKGTLALLMTFVSLVILPPIAEEIVVRGLLYTSLKKALPLIGAVLSTSAIFAIVHLPAGGAAGPLYIAAIDTFVLSLILIYLREKTGGLWASMTLHALKNGIAFFVIFIAPLLSLQLL